MKPHTVTLKGASEISGICRSSFYRLFDQGMLKPRKCGKRVLIVVEELEEFLNSLPVSKGGSSHDI